MIREIEAFQDVLNKFIQMRVDSNEYVYLRAIVLYKCDTNNNNDDDKDRDVISSTSDDSEMPSFSGKSLAEPAKVKTLGKNAKEALAAYEQSYYPIAHQMRYKSLLGLLPALKLVSHFTIEELFFRRNIGHVPLLKLLVDLYLQQKKS